MSYPYPSHFLPLGSDMEVPNSGFAPSYDAPGSGQASMDQGTREPTDQERRDSILQASRRKSKRSMNKPNVRLRQANISDSSQSGQAGDKKRNKLGYHRTSVACDQAPSQMTEAKPKAQPRPAGGSNTASASSSPVVLPGQAPEGSQHYQHHQGGVLPSPQNVLPTTIQTSAAGNLVPVSSTTTSSQPYDFANPQITNWASPDISSNYATKSGDLRETKKPYAEQSPITPSPSFSPYTSQAPPSASWSNADINAQNNMGYSSFTIGNPMAYPRGTQIPTQYPTMSQQGRQFPRRSSTVMTTDMYTNPIATSFPTMDPHTVSMSAGANPPSGYGTWPQQQQQQQQPPYGYPRPSEGYDTWTAYDNSSGR
ncbi:fungal Zn binuclear cluster domain containing protein [Colletotrichum scovillei]|uniref:Fungal Zn binuclear cluster domain containing protein n=1 Tax=Colletotrichum scovillei TaxID=1209932 RepID=A0A9P7U7W1_9PEZI|nr:fungal Zn binuclear cluster domain containing protein [Colletotrichum scovillei]